jgi:hypothetical protein
MMVDLYAVICNDFRNLSLLWFSRHLSVIEASNLTNFVLWYLEC